MTTSINTNNTGSLQHIRTHTLAAVAGLTLAVAAVAGGVVALSQRDAGTAVPAPRTAISLTRPVNDDWRHIYYIVPTQGAGDLILNSEYELQNTILINQGELPHRTIHVFVADTPEQQYLLGSMMAEASPETTEFIDTRLSPLPAVVLEEPAGITDEAPVLSVVEPLVAPEAVLLYQPYPCSVAEELQPFMVELLAGLCQ